MNEYTPEEKIIQAVVVLLAIVACILILAGKTCFGADEWTKGDTARQIAFTAITLVDMSQTVKIATERTKPYSWSNPDGSGGTVYGGKYCWKEMNPILGEHPTEHQVYAYFAAAIITIAVVARLLPRNWRAPFQYVSIGVQGAFVVWNFNQGVRP